MAEVTDALVLKVAGEASADRRSVIRALAGLPVRGLPGQRINRVLEAHGIARVKADCSTSDPTPPKAA
jgi:hypothetical protein